MNTTTLFGMALFAVACGPSSGGQGVKTPDQLLADQEKIQEESDKRQAASGDNEPVSAGETDMEKKKKFDHKQTEMELKRASRGAASCVGVVTDDSPHGKAQVSLKFGNDGHVKESSIAAPFDGTPIGKCALNAMAAVIVPSYVGADETVEWEIDLSAPEGEEGDKGKGKDKGKKK